jgi:hypothetical protein
LGLSLTYWLALMCAGNVWGYVPIPGDHHARRYCHRSRGLHLSVWVLCPFLLIPSLWIT